MAAISRVLSGSPAARSIPASTQERIFAAAQQFKYRPNLLARSLRQGRSTSIGVIIPEISEGYATPILAGIEETLSAAGYILVMLTHHHRAEVLARAQQMFAERAVDGVIAVDTTIPLIGPMPIVTVSCPNHHPSGTSILLNQHRAAELALAHLYELGHRRVAIIRGQAFSSESEVRWQAIQEACRSLGLVLTNDLVVQMEEDLATSEPGYRATEKLLEQSRSFSAIFAFNDVSAIGAMSALRDAGLRVPEDVSVLGFDNVTFAGIHRPGLTTIRQPLHEMGVLAASAVLKMLTGGAGAAPQAIVVEPELIVRSSTKRFSAHSCE